MRYSRRPLPWTILAVLSLSLALPAAHVNAQKMQNHLEARLAQAGLPIKSLEVAEWPSAVVRLVLQSTSTGERVAPEDPAYEHAVDRVLALALRDGIQVALLDLTIVNSEGQPIHWTLGMPVNRAFAEREYPPAQMGEPHVAEWAQQALPFGGLKLDSTEVTRDGDGWDEVRLRVSAPDLEAANASVGAFMRGTLEQVEQFNTRGGQVALVRIDLVDAGGTLLLRHVRDYQLWQEHWWQAEGLAGDWYPSPTGDGSSEG